jgi:EAL domain-containing protein (putative c-di-GMP-specific phosphodiesterase class I)
VAYQPKIDLHTGRVASVEALVRWPANDSQVVPTVLMVETAERAGLIGSLTSLVLNNVLRERSGWAQQGLDMQVWVNLSAQSLAQKELPATLLQSLEVWNVPSSAIGLEITESGLISDIEHTTGILQALRNVGFELAIDDFGTGYSSLAYLRRFPISELKIDRMFVHGMVNSPPDRQIVQSIIDLAHNFNLKVVAEGAEDLDTVAALKSLGCDVVQGYVYAKPMPAEHIPDWVSRFEAG